MQNLNHKAVIAAAVAMFVFPVIWYTIFNEQWLALSGLTEEQAQAAPPISYLYAFIASLAMAYTLAWVFDKIPVTNWQDGIVKGLILGLGFFFLETLVQDMFLFKPIDLTLINAGHSLVNFGIAGAILGAWKK